MEKMMILQECSALNERTIPTLQRVGQAGRGELREVRKEGAVL